MEDVLELYARPFNPKEPVVCLDEKPIQLIADIVPPLPGKPGSIARQDNEYKRCGTANVFCSVEPLAGRYIIVATHNRTGPQYAKMLARIARRYPNAKTIHLVQDNLNTHTLKSLIRQYGEIKGRALWKRFTIHYVPKHGSWLNMAETAISIYSSQCLRRRIPDFETLDNETRAWNRIADRKRIKIHWKFSVEKARGKFKYSRRDGNVKFKVA